MYAAAAFSRSRDAKAAKASQRTLTNLALLVAFVGAASVVYTFRPVRQPFGGGAIRGWYVDAGVPAPTAPPRPGPPRNASWAPEQRPLPDSDERSISSHKFTELTQHSEPPPLPPTGDLATRLILAIGCGVHGGRNHATPDNIGGLRLINTLLHSFTVTASPTFLYRFYFAYDHNDASYEKAEVRAAITAAFAAALAAENARRWHPAGFVGGEPDYSTLVATVHWVHCDFFGKPAWAHNDAIMAAYREGADYAYRTNDDTWFPVQGDWGDRMIQVLRSRQPIPNLGVVGPTCPTGATWILTHDMTHRTHAIVFGFLYPRSLPDWSSDDWITLVYTQLNLMSVEPLVTVRHQEEALRYAISPEHVRVAALNAELAAGGAAVAAWAAAEHHRALNFTVIVKK